MKITRLVELSLNYAVQKRFMKVKTNDVAKANADFTVYKLKYNSIDTETDVIVTVNNSTISSGYSVDYINGVINFSPALTSSDTVKVTYKYCPINIYNEGSNPSDDNFKYPAVAIYTEGDNRYPFELGSSKREIVADWVITVMADKGGKRQDITDEIMEMLEEDLPIINYNLGFPTSRDNTKNLSFDPNAQTIGYMTSESINSDKGGSLDIGDTPKYISDIFVELKIII